MLRRRRFSFLLSLALVASLSFASVSRAQSDAGAPARRLRGATQRIAPGRQPRAAPSPGNVASASARAATGRHADRRLSAARHQPRPRPARPGGARGAGARAAERWPARTKSSARLVGQGASGHRAARLLPHPRRSCSTTSSSAATTRASRPGRPAVPLAASARPVVSTTNGAAGGQNVAVCGPQRQPELLRQDRVERQPALPPQPRDPHLGQPAHHDAARSRSTTWSSARRRSRTRCSRWPPARPPRAHAKRELPDRVPAGAVQRRLRAGELRAHRLPRRRRGRRPPASTGGPNSINVKRVWGEYMTPVGQIRFGRMPDQWGLGWSRTPATGSTATTSRPSTASCSSAASSRWTSTSAARGTSSPPGPTNANPFDVYGGQPYNTCNLCNVNEWVAFVAHRTNPELQKPKLARGDFVLNGGVYTHLPLAVPRRPGGRRQPEHHRLRTTPR